MLFHLQTRKMSPLQDSAWRNISVHSCFLCRVRDVVKAKPMGQAAAWMEKKTVVQLSALDPMRYLYFLSPLIIPSSCFRMQNSEDQTMLLLPVPRGILLWVFKANLTHTKVLIAVRKNSYSDKTNYELCLSVFHVRLVTRIFSLAGRINMLKYRKSSSLCGLLWKMEEWRERRWHNSIWDETKPQLYWNWQVTIGLPQGIVSSVLFNPAEFQPLDPTQEPIFPPELLVGIFTSQRIQLFSWDFPLQWKMSIASALLTL